ncbi:sensor histidine kinase [Effusibacillus pohliae]|uniref:sensor histidine kinase n=1 Tax=Effusibacillus pohliae TaxID=232270 RepID=UPI00035CDF5A|nr:sensor histidine kinase [Effusibacillus pohliae]
MSYRQIKWLILAVPTVTIGLWEFIRHEYLLPYISMELGNWLSPLVVMIVTFGSLWKLFSLLERLQEDLNRERAAKAILEERERIARELHDGIAQSLFLLSVRMHQLEQRDLLRGEHYQALRDTVRRVHDDVRQAISNLRFPPTGDGLPWTKTVQDMIQDFEKETRVPVSIDWDLDEGSLSSKEKVEISACLREALMNIRKHANARHAAVRLLKTGTGWSLTVEDDGQGFKRDPFGSPSRYGLRMMRERAEEMGWQFRIERDNGRTRIVIRKENQA